MALKDKLLENKKLNEQIKFAIAEEQSRLPFNLGESDTKVEPIDFADLFMSWRGILKSLVALGFVISGNGYHISLDLSCR